MSACTKTCSNVSNDKCIEALCWKCCRKENPNIYHHMVHPLVHKCEILYTDKTSRDTLVRISKIIYDSIVQFPNDLINIIISFIDDSCIKCYNCGKIQKESDKYRCTFLSYICCNMNFCTECYSVANISKKYHEYCKYCPYGHCFNRLTRIDKTCICNYYIPVYSDLDSDIE